MFIATEFVEGQTPKRWLKSQARTRRAILDVFLGAGEGLAAAHHVGLIHRDFKPDNVMVGADATRARARLRAGARGELVGHGDDGWQAFSARRRGGRSERVSHAGRVDVQARRHGRRARGAGRDRARAGADAGARGRDRARRRAHLAAAHAATGAARAQAAGAARVALERALRLNDNLEHELRPMLDEAAQLARAR